MTNSFGSPLAVERPRWPWCRVDAGMAPPSPDVAAFGEGAVADSHLAVPRRPVARCLGPGVHVSVRADVFGKQYAKDTFGNTWRTARVCGTIRRATGHHEWAVDFVDGTQFVCTSRQLRREVQLPDGITDAASQDGGSSSDDDYELMVSEEEDLSALIQGTAQDSPDGDDGGHISTSSSDDSDDEGTSDDDADGRASDDDTGDRRVTVTGVRRDASSDSEEESEEENSEEDTAPS